jgi:hypothetical protein
VITIYDELIIGWAVDGLSDVVVGQSNNLAKEDHPHCLRQLKHL